MGGSPALSRTEGSARGGRHTRKGEQGTDAIASADTGALKTSRRLTPSSYVLLFAFVGATDGQRCQAAKKEASCFSQYRVMTVMHAAAKCRAVRG